MVTSAGAISYCCEVFAAHVADAGRRGASIFPAQVAGVLCFVMQSRGYDYVDLPAAQEMSRQIRAAGITPAPTVNLSSEMRISFCPWCGARLEVLIARQRDLLEVKAKESAFLLSRPSGNETADA